MEYDPKKVIRTTFDALAELFNSVFPGIIALDLFFRKGIFHTMPNDIYTFIVYAIWAGVLSLPYNFLHPVIVETYWPKVLEYCKTLNVTFDDGPEAKEIDKQFDTMIEMGFIMSKCALLYILLKIYQYQTLWKLPKGFWDNSALLFIVLTALVLLISIPVAHLYINFIIFILKKYYRKLYGKRLHPLN